MSREVELKLEIAPGAAEALAGQRWLADAERKTQRQRSVYYDTPASELRRRGYTLRVRTVGERFIQTVKSLGSGAGLFQRGEWEYEIGGPEPNVEKLGSTPLAGIDTGTLTPVVCCDVERTVWRLRGHHAEVEIDLDEGAMEAVGRNVPICEVELELVHGEPASAIELAQRIAQVVPVRLSVMSKAERAFALADGTLGCVTKAENVNLDEGMSVAEGFETIVMACVRHFRLNEPLVTESRPPEALHQARVAMRRLRSALTLFRTAIFDAEFLRIRDELRWFASELGDARNLDVYLQRELPEGERARLSERREAAYDMVIAAMDSARFRALMLDLIAWASFGKWRHGHEARSHLAPYMNDRIDRLWHKISRAHDVARLDEERRHRLRIQVKKLRYALEFAATLHGVHKARQKRFARAVEDLQEELGHLNDIVVARSLLTAEAWPIYPPAADPEEERHLASAKEAIAQLAEAGPYWRKDVPAP